jgi:hypothetical protein
MTEELMGRLRAGKIDRRNLESQRRSAFRGARAARADVKSVVLEIGRAAFGHVASELEAQDG